VEDSVAGSIRRSLKESIANRYKMPPGRSPMEKMLWAMIEIDVAPALKPAIASDESRRLESRRHVRLSEVHILA